MSKKILPRLSVGADFIWHYKPPLGDLAESSWEITVSHRFVVECGSALLKFYTL